MFGMIQNRLSGYDRALMEIRKMSVDLSEMVKVLVDKALNLLNDPREGERIHWRQEDKLIDQRRDHVVQRILEIMSLQQLRTQDLRWLLGYQRIVQELERIADYACDIAELAILSADLGNPSEIFKMAEQTALMYEKSFKALQLELDFVDDIDQDDDVLDEIYADLQRQFLAETQRTRCGVLGFPLILARTMERMGDHIFIVAKSLAYIQTGESR